MLPRMARAPVELIQKVPLFSDLDKRELKEDVKEGDKADAKRDVRDLKRDERDTNRDKRDARADKRDLKHDRTVALKVLHRELAAALGADR